MSADDTIAQIAKKLGKIKLDNDKIGSDIQSILGYIDLLEEVDTTDVEPTVNIAEHLHILRNDHLNHSEITRKELLDCSNQQVIQDHIAIGHIL